MKSRRAKVAIRIGLGCGILFVAAPLLAGYFRIGARDGPAFYHKSLHTSLYILGHEAASGEKPRMSLAWALYNRPLFWGLKRRPKPESERKAYIQRIIELRGADSPVVEWLQKEQDKIKTGQQAGASNGG